VARLVVGETEVRARRRTDRLGRTGRRVIRGRDGLDQRLRARQPGQLRAETVRSQIQTALARREVLRKVELTAAERLEARHQSAHAVLVAKVGRYQAAILEPQ
jgi:hypothetical protein